MKKKNPFLHSAIWLMALAILATCAFAGNTTLAMYASAGSGEGSAVVAGWSIIVTDGNIDQDIAITPVFTEDVSLFEVINDHATGDVQDMLAPGTDGSFDGLKVENASDVDALITIEITLDNPQEVPLKIGGVLWTGATDTFTYSDTVSPGGFLTVNGDFDWVWDYEDASGSGPLGDPDDTMNYEDDTKIGVAAAAGEVKVIATVKVFAVQVD